MNIQAVIDALRARGVSDTDILDAISAGYVAPISTVTADERAAVRAARNARYYEARKQRLKTSETSYSDDKGFPPSQEKERSPTPPKENPTLPTSSKISVQRQRSTPSDFFDRLWSAYPKREGSNPKQPALKSFNRAVAAGADPEAIIRGAQHYAAEQKGKDPRFVAQTVTWINQERWNDHVSPSGKDPPGPEEVPRFETEEAFQAWWNKRMGVTA